MTQVRNGRMLADDQWPSIPGGLDTHASSLYLNADLGSGTDTCFPGICNLAGGELTGPTVLPIGQACWCDVVRIWKVLPNVC